MKYSQPGFNIFVLVATSVIVSGCGSISFFPTAPALKAADKVIDDIWPVQPTATLKGVTASPPASPAPNLKHGTK